MRYRIDRWLRVGGRARTAVLFAALCCTLIAGSYLARAHPITVDGSAAEWSNRAPNEANTALVVRNSSDQGEYVWRDAAADERTSFASPDPRVDIREVRYTASATDLNVLVKVGSLPVTSGADTTQVQLAIDSDLAPASGQASFIRGDAFVASAASWERLLQTRFGGGSTAVAVYTAGVATPAFAGSARNASDGTIELSVPWGSLGLAGPPESPLRFTVATFRSTLDDDPRDVGDASVPNVLDVVSDYGDPGTSPNTSSEFATDQIVDYFSDVYFTPAGEVEAPLLISRFAPNQASAAAEFVEVANATSVTLNLSSFKLGDEASTTANAEGMHSFPVGTTLAAGARAIVARSGAAYQTAFGQLPDFELEPNSAAPNMNQFGIWSAGAPDFADAGEELLVLDRANTIVDVVTYGVPPVAFPGLVPKTPAPAAGEQQKRMPSLRDTDDNQTDFSLTSCAGSKTFDGGPAGTGTQWDVAANWSGDTLPGAGDNVCIPNLPITGVVFDSGTHNVQSVTSDEPFTLSGGTLNVNSLVQPSTLTSLTMTTGTMGGGGNVDITNTFTWSGGTLSGVGTTSANGGLTLNGTTKTLQRTLVNNGTANWTAGQINFTTPAALRNPAGRLFDIQFDGTMTWASGADPIPTFENAGTVRKSAGAGITAIQVGFPNSGTVDVDTGRLGLYQWARTSSSTGTFNVPTGSALEFQNGTYNLNAGSAINGAGLVEVGGATVNVNGTYSATGTLLVSSGVANLTPGPTVSTLRVTGGALNLATATSDATAQNLVITSGTLTGPADVTVNGLFTWSGGTMAGAGTTFANGGITLDGTTKTLNRTLENNGAATWTNGQINMTTPAVFRNPAGRTFDIQADATMTWASGSDPIPTLENAGTVTKSAGAGAASIQVGLPNTGSVAVTSGRLHLYQWARSSSSTGSFTVAPGSAFEFQNGTYDLDAGSSMSGGGTVEVAGATVNVGGTYTPTTTTVTSGVLNLNVPVSLANVSLSAGTLGGSGNLTASSFTWTGGTHAASSVATTTTVTNSLQLGGTTKTLSRRTFNNNTPTGSPTTWAVGNLGLNSGAIFNNRGRIVITGDNDWTGDVNQTVNNVAGATIEKNGGGENTYIENTFNNDGTVLATLGHLRLLTNGSHSGPFTIGSSGVIEFEGGTQTSGGAISGEGPLDTPTGLSGVADTTGGSLATGTYFYRVAARNINGETLASSEISVPVTGPAGRVTLSWNAVPKATSYRLYRGTASGAQNVFFTATGTGFVDTGAGATGGSPQTVNNSHARAYFSGGTITLNGSYDVPTTWVGGGTTNFNGPTAFNELHVFGGIGAMNRPNIDVAFLSLSGGAIGGTGQLTVAGPRASSWTGGTMHTSGTTLVAPGVTLNAPGASVKDLHTGRVLRNEGTINWTGTGNLRTGSNASVDNVGVFDVQSDADLNTDFGGVTQFLNTGAFRKTAGTGAANPTDISLPFDNDGTVLAQAGYLRLNSGDGPNASNGVFTVQAALDFSGATYDLGTASTVSGPGTVFFTAGQTNLTGTYDIATTSISGGTSAFEATNSVTDVLNLSGGVLAGGGRFTIEGPGASTWSGGTMQGSGTTFLPAGVTLNAPGGTVKDLHTGRVLRNEGMIAWSGTGNLRTGSNALLDNVGVFEMQTDADLNTDFGGTTLFLNTGTFRKTAGTGAANPTDISLPFDNDGTLLAQAGYLRFNSGDGPNTSNGVFTVPATIDFSGATYDLGASSTVNAAGTVLFTAGQTNVNGVYDVATTNVQGGTAAFEATGPVTDVLNLSGGSLAGSGRLTAEGPGPSTWTAGTMQGTGTTRLGPGVTLNVSGTTVKDIHSSRVLRNEGTIFWTGTGNIRSGNAVVENVGVFDVQTDADFNQDFGGIMQIRNTGVLRKSVGAVAPASTDFSVTVDNTGGRIEALAGTLNLNAAFANYNAATDVLTGGSYLVRSILRFNNADVVTNNATVVLDTAASRVFDHNGLDGLRNFAVNGAQGDFSITGGRSLFLPGTPGPNLTNNGVLRGAGGSYFQNVTNNGTVAPGASPGILTIGGNYTQSATGKLEIEVGGTTVAGTDYDRLAVVGNATLNGTLTAKLFGGFVPATGVGIDVLTAASRTGTFAVVDSVPSPLPGNLLPEARYDTTSVKLFAVPGGGAADDSVSEGAGLKTISVTLSAPSSEAITVDYATADGTAQAGSDYQAASGTLTFPAGDTSKTFDVTIVDDARDEPDQTFVVNLTSASGTLITDTQATITIADNDELPSISIADLQKAEGSAEPVKTAFTVQASLSAVSEKTITVAFATADDTAVFPADYVAASGTVTFDPGETTKPVTIQVEGDTRVEFDENFFVDFATPVNATIAKARGLVTILDDDQGAGASQLSIGDAAVVVEGDAGSTNAVFTVGLAPAAAAEVRVDYSTSDASAQAGLDYTAQSGTLIFAPGETSKQISVLVSGDRLDESVETFNVALAGPTGASLSSALGVGTITDDDETPVAVGQSGSTDEDTAKAITLGATDGDADTLAFELLTAPLHGTLGPVSGNQVTYTPAADYHGVDSFTFRANDGFNQSNVATVSISVSSVNDAPVASDMELTTDEDTPVSFRLQATDPDVEPVGFTIVDEPAHGTATRTGDQVTYEPDPNFHGDDSFTFEASDEDGDDSNLATVSLVVTSVNDAPVARDDAKTTAFNTSVEIDVRANDSDVETTGLLVTEFTDPPHGTVEDVGEGILRYTPDTNYTGSDSFDYSISDASGGSDSATVSVQVAPPGGGGPLLSIADSSPTTEGADQTFSVSMSNPPLLPVTVDVRTADDTARAGEDYVFFQTTLTFGIGFPAVQTVVVKGIQDALDEDAEEFHVNLVTSGVGVSDAQAIGTIEDNDAMPSVAIGSASTTEGNSGPASLTFPVALIAASGRPVTVQYATEDGTASAPGDYTATGGTLTFAPGQLVKTVTVDVHGDTEVEPDETLAVRLSNASNAVISATTGTGTIGNDDSTSPPPPPPPPPVTPPPPPPPPPVTPPPPPPPPPPPAERTPRAQRRIEAGFVCTQIGTPGRDVMLGTKGRDVICGLGGADTLVGVGDNDVLIGGLGSDTLLGGAGRDRLLGGLGSDRLLGGLGKDRLFGGAGKDVLDGGLGNDRLDGGQGQDLLLGRAGHDTLLGAAGNDRLRGGPGIDTIDGGAGVDVLDTRDKTRGSDRISGGLGKDRCLADAGSPAAKSCP